jgi:outer membrane protein assembly factor BamB
VVVILDTFQESIVETCVVLARSAVIGLTASLIALAQRPAGWTTFSGDPQRTGWAKSETEFNKDNVKNLKLQWSLKLDNAAKELNGLTAPLVTRNLITPKGFRELVVVAGASDKVFAIDSDTGKLFWQRTLTIEGTPKQKMSHWLCPNALNATPVIGPAPGSQTTNPFRGPQAVYVLSSDGKLHAFNIVNGEDLLPPTPFVPPFGKTWSLSLVNNVVYTNTSQGCNGVKSGVYAMDLSDPGHKVSYFQAGAAGAGIWGRAGAAITPSGKVLVETGDGPYDLEKGNMSDSVIELSEKDLKLADYYTPANRAWITRKDLDMGNMTPVVFPFKDWELVAAAGKEGVLYLLDAKSLGGADHRTPLFRSPLYTNEEVNFAARGFWGALSTWQDPSGTRWLYAPAWGPPATDAKFPLQYGLTPNGSIMAFKVEVQDGKPVLLPQWNSRDMSVPEPVVIANGLVFALSDGDCPLQSDPNGGILSSQERAAKAGTAVLYVLDALTGQELFSSGDAIHDFTHFSAPVVADGRVYVVTHDSTVYSFGLGQ